MIFPLGFQLDPVIVTWQVTDTKALKQSAAQVIVSENADMSNVTYDTKMDSGLSSLGVELPIELKPRTRYYWTVTVMADNKERGTSEINWFETGKREESWAARWITPVWKDFERHPLMKRPINIEKKVKNARAYVSGLGVYEFYMNGIRVGAEYLAPGCTTYDEWVQYQTYDVTSCMKMGENVIGAMLGNGWAKGRFGTFGDANSPYVEQFFFLAEIHLEYEDGSHEVVVTDRSWQCHEAPVLEDSIYDGEVYDARKEVKYWGEGVWDEVQEKKPECVKSIEERLSLPVVVKELRRPIRLLHTPAGETVLDMGQNMAGWIRFHVKEPAGTVVKLSYGEILQEDNFYRENLRTAKAQYTYIADGNEREVEPHFTYYGFRYVKLEGFTAEISVEDFTGCVVYSDLEETGKIETSDPLVNRLFLNAKWGQKSNFLDVPTDCPQRDERMGWTGDTQVFAKTASFNMDTYAFYTRFLHDLWMDQRQKNGMVGNVIPCFMKVKQEISMPYHGGSAVWGDCATILPWEMYQQYGDISILKKQYESMKAWVDWIHRRDTAAGDTGLWKGDYQWGDWLALDEGTDEDFIASAYYKHSAEIVSRAAAVLGKEEDKQKYGELADKVRQAVFDEYFSKNGRSTINTQTAYLLALKFNLVPKEHKKRTVDALAALLKKNQMHLQTGFVGTPFLCNVLSDYGYSRMAYEIFLQEDFPGWLYAVKMGATTIWERWDSVLSDGRISGTGMNSLNHYAYGSIVEWMYTHMCGIRSKEGKPGFSEFEIRPEIDSHIFGAKASYQSPKGLIESGWKREVDGTMTVRVTVPFDAEAEVYLPYAKEEESRVKVEAGTHEFTYPLTKDFRNCFSLEYSLKDLKANPEARRALEEIMPSLESIPAEFEEKSESFYELLNGTFRMAMGDTVDGLIVALNQKLGEVEIPVRQAAFSLEDGVSKADREGSPD